MIRRIFPAAFLLLATLAGEAATLTLNWRDNSSNESAFQIERAEPGGAFLALATVAGNATAYVDNTVALNRDYRYRVRGINAGGVSAWSSEATGRQSNAAPPPVDKAPDQLTITPEGQLANISSRGLVTASDTTLIPGFAVSSGPVRALIRVVGPRIGEAPFNVPGVCADPRLEVRDANGTVVAANDNWSGTDIAEAAALVDAFDLTSGSKDAAVILLLQPGTYTVVARGVNGATGIALAEVYKLPQ